MYGDLWAWFDLIERWAYRRVVEVERWLDQDAITVGEAEKMLTKIGHVGQVSKLQAVEFLSS